MLQMTFKRAWSWLNDARIHGAEVKSIDLTVSEIQSSELASLCDLYGSDKGSQIGRSPYFPWPPHNYTAAYERVLSVKRDTTRAVFECGIGTNDTSFPSNMSEAGKPGASLRMWRDYFPRAKVFGADIDPSCLFTENRIATGQMDQFDRNSVENCFKDSGVATYDLIVDDGYHSTGAAIAFFDNSFQFLAAGGDYFVEDLVAVQIPGFVRHIVKRGLRPTVWQITSPWRPLHDGNTLLHIHKES